MEESPLQSEGRNIKRYQVKKVDPNSVIVLDENGQEILCLLRGRFKKNTKRNKNFIRVGDFVEIEEDNSNFFINSIEKRKTSLSRPHSHFSEDEHVIAANVDQIIVVVSFKEPELKTGLIDRYSVVAELNQLPLIICFNKADLADLTLYNEIIETYQKIGYKTVLTSILDGEGIEELKEVIKNKTSVFSGHSGVGKSSLINLVDNKIELKTGSVSNFSKKGTHTTTSAELFVLETGKIIDTPGIKEFGLWGFEKESLSLYFKEFRDIAEDCKFYNCSHVHEPKCAIKKALDEGLISAFRYKNYLSMIDELSLNKNY